jgi:hypothetical protein
MNTFKWSREKAFAQACVDWRNGQATVGTITNEVPAKRNNTVFKVVKFDFTAQKYSTIDVFNTKEEAQKCLMEKRVGALTIGEKAQFDIVEVVQSEVKQVS